MVREGCQVGSKQERDVGKVAPRRAGRMGMKTREAGVRARCETKGKQNLVVE